MSYGSGRFHRMGHTYCRCGWVGRTKSALALHLERAHWEHEPAARLRREVSATWDQAMREGRAAPRVKWMQLLVTLCGKLRAPL